MTAGGPHPIVAGYVVPRYPQPLLTPDAHPSYRALRDAYAGVLDGDTGAVEFELVRGRHCAIVTAKSRGEVTLVGPFHKGKNEGPCRSLPFDAATVPSVDLDARQIVVEPPDGLLGDGW